MEKNYMRELNTQVSVAKIIGWLCLFFAGLAFAIATGKANGGVISLQDRVSALEADLIVCCSTQYQDMASEGMVSAVGRLNQKIEGLEFQIEVLERFLGGKGEVQNETSLDKR